MEIEERYLQERKVIKSNNIIIPFLIIYWR